MLFNHSFVQFAALLLAGILFVGPLSAQTETEQPDHSAWDSLLQKHVSAAGKVNYKGFKADQAALDAYCQDLSAHAPQEAWSRQEKMAFWINAYNAFTVQLVVTHFPIGSIRDLDKGKTWDVRRIEIGGKKYSLNQIENDILRPKFKDARIHFALNCAAKSCPPLANQAFTAQNLNKLLDKRTRQFINNKKYNDFATDKAKISMIFNWYAADFGDVKAFLNKYLSSKITETTGIEYLDYDWRLND